MNRLRLMWKKCGKHLIKVLVLGFTIVRIVILLDPTEALASAPWTITTHFGDIDSIHTKPHKGVDFALPEGTPLKSVVEGKVALVKDEGSISFGKSVRIITPDGRLVIYGHLHDATVRTGDMVHFGDTIAHSGNTGHSTGPHLHFQVNINGKPVNPMPTIYEGMMKKKSLVGGISSAITH